METLDQLYEKLILLSESSEDKNVGMDDKESWIFQTYDLRTESGKKFFNYLKDEHLLNILKKTAKEVNHSPAQKEVFWVWRVYIKERFKRWPYALEAAGLSKAAGINGKTLEEIEKEKKEYERLLGEVREKAEKLCRIPHPQDIPEVCEKLKDFTDNWNKVIKAAGLNREFFHEKSVYKIKNLEEEYKKDLQEILQLASDLGRSPLKREVSPDVRKKVIIRCGSWRNALFQIGLEPVMKINPFSSTHIRKLENEEEKNHQLKIQDCQYQVLNPSVQTQKDLEMLKNLKQNLGHMPSRKEVPAELRKRLQESCGSWANASYQLKYLKEGEESYE